MLRPSERTNSDLLPVQPIFVPPSCSKNTSITSKSSNLAPEDSYINLALITKDGKNTNLLSHLSPPSVDFQLLPVVPIQPELCHCLQALESSQCPLESSALRRVRTGHCRTGFAWTCNMRPSSFLQRVSSQSKIPVIQTYSSVLCISDETPSRHCSGPQHG